MLWDCQLCTVPLLGVSYRECLALKNSLGFLSEIFNTGVAVGLLWSASGCPRLHLHLGSGDEPSGVHVLNSCLGGGRGSGTEVCCIAEHFRGLLPALTLLQAHQDLCSVRELLVGW